MSVLRPIHRCSSNGVLRLAHLFKPFFSQVRSMAQVKIVEVGPRDGLQNIPGIVPTDVKIELIQRLARTGLSVIEATSFVSPKWVPQLADGQEVMRAISPLIQSRNSIEFPVLVPNIKGLEKAHLSGATEVAVFVSATEGFSKKNINCSVNESLLRVKEVGEMAKDMGIQVRGYVSCIFADPYDGPTHPAEVTKVTQALIDAGCYEVSLGDTLGVGTPSDVERLLTLMLKSIPAKYLAGHFHDTYGQAVANVVKSYELGIRTFDSSVAGLGGCPFAQGAKGNLSTEDLVYTLEKMGISTGVDLEKLAATGTWISQQLQIPNGSRAGSAITAKAREAQLLTPSPRALTLDWILLESSDEYRVYRSGCNINIRLTRPRNGNALTKSMIHALTRLFREFSDDDSVFNIVLSATGKHFCTGMDLKNAGTSEEQFADLKELFHTIDTCTKTTIAAINGPCYGGGVGLAFVCDLRLATANSTFKLSEVQLGLCPATISKYIIREWGIPFSRVAMLTARVIQPSELASSNALYKVVRDEAELDVELGRVLDSLRFSAPKASSLSKKLVNAAWTDAGGENQATVIESAFRKMMAKGSESEYALKQFRNGIKGIDWPTLLSKQPQAKL